MTRPPARPWLLGLLAIVIVGAGFWAIRGRRDVRSAIPTLQPRAMRIVPGVYLLGGLEPSAAYVIDTGEGYVLVDSGLDREATLLKEQMKELGLDWTRIRIVLLTHAH